MQIKPVLVLFLDKRRKKKSGQYPLKLRLTYNREQRYYALGIDLTEEQFRLIENKSLQKGLPRKDISILEQIERKAKASLFKAEEVLHNIAPFSISLFEKRLFANKQINESVFVLFDEHIQRMMKAGRIGTASSYRTCMNSLKGFKQKIRLADITAEFLNEYELWMLNEGKSRTTVGIYLRALRAVFNEAIDDGLISREYYPFGKRKYQIPSARNNKRALDDSDMKKLYEYRMRDDDFSWEAKARDFFILSYLCNGMNIKDILLLKHSDISGDRLEFMRAKSMETKRISQQPIKVVLHDEAKRIIKKWRALMPTLHDYLFPELSKDDTELKKFAKVQQFTKMVNKYLRRCAEEVGIDKPITTYYARHSYASKLKRAGFSIEFIGESLGHSSPMTTKNYLGSFSDDAIRQSHKHLVDFVNH